MSSIWLIVLIVLGVCIIALPAIIIPIIVGVTASSRAKKVKKSVERTLPLRK